MRACGRFMLPLLLLSFSALSGEPAVSAPTPELVERLTLSPFYKQCVITDGFAVVSSEKVHLAAVREAAWIVNQMLRGRDDIRQALVQKKIRLAVMAATEFTTDIPEHSDLKPKSYWNRRARGLGATLSRPAVSCAEENLLGFPGDPYKGENILVHEFSHAIHEISMARLEPGFDAELKTTFEQAIKQGLWKGTYAATNHREYWAEGVQSWFDCNASNNAQHNHVCTREQLAAYDPRLAILIAHVFPDNNWRYTTPDKRKTLGHLAGWNPSDAVPFKFSIESIDDKTSEK